MLDHETASGHFHWDCAVRRGIALARLFRSEILRVLILDANIILILVHLLGLEVPAGYGFDFGGEY